MEKSLKIQDIHCPKCKAHCKLTRKPQKFGIFLKITQFEHFMCRIHQKLGTFDVIFLKNWEIHKILCTTNHKSNIIVVENSEKSGFSTNSKQIFAKYLLFYMWFYKGIKVNILATTQKNCCSINLQNKSCTNNQNYCRKHRNSLNSVPNTIENIQFKK